jgi:uncharacterized protein YkvS
MEVKPRDIIETKDGLVGEVISVLTNTVVANISLTPNIEKLGIEHMNQVFHHKEFTVVKKSS